jgi:hypothetical protein
LRRARESTRSACRDGTPVEEHSKNKRQRIYVGAGPFGLENNHQDDDEDDQAAKSDVHSRSSYQTIND